MLLPILVAHHTNLIFNHIQPASILECFINQNQMAIR